jgi:hypothetical protein
MPRRMTRLKQDPFLGALTDQQRLEPAIPKLEGAGSTPVARSSSLDRSRMRR